MTYSTFIVVYCDGGTPDCAWGNDPMQGDANETLTELLRRGGWVTRKGKHLCPQCQHPELQGRAHSKQRPN